MAGWQELIYKRNLNYYELRMIPSASCENYIVMKNYFVKELQYTEEELLCGLSITREEFHDPKNWINSADEQLFHINLFKRPGHILTHYDYREAGRFFSFSENSLFMIFFKVLSAGKIIKEIQKTVRKFNNEYTIRPVSFRNGEAYLLQKDYPFYHEVSVGGECRFTEGVFAANFELHDIHNYSVEQIICSKKLKNLLTYAYGHYGFDIEDTGKQILINGRPVAEYVELAKQKIGNEFIYSSKVVPEGKNHNATRILEDFVYRGKTLLRKGEIYDAPYCLFYLKWKEKSTLIRVLQALKRKSLLTQSLNEIDKQLEFTNKQIFELKQSLAESDRRLKIMELYTRSSLVEKIKNGEDPSGFVPEEKNISVLFNDIRGFTSLVENLKVIDVVYLLNYYFNNVNEVISECNGEVDKLIGDCVMAGFHSPDDAVKAGILIKQKISSLNHDIINKWKYTIHTGIGITYGSVIVGNIGSDCKLDYTLIGDSVNVASRLEALTKTFKVGFIISEDLKNQLRGPYDIRFIDTVKIKGRHRPLAVYEVFDYERDDVKRVKYQIQTYLDEAYQYYLDAEFQKAVRIYRFLLKKLPTNRWNPALPVDPLLFFYLKRAKSLQRKLERGELEKENWNGIYNCRIK